VTWHGWFPDREQYWIAGGETAAYPVRQGDLVQGLTVEGERWEAAQLVHPTCELAKPSVERLQVVRVRPLADLRDDFARRLVTLGYRDRGGARPVAAAHTFFLAPWPGRGEPAFANFRELTTLERGAASPAARVATMTHECRVAWIRRWIYFRLRLTVTTEQVRGWEAKRIANDPSFEGPRPDWAELDR
jgi:hypothetical protein